MSYKEENNKKIRIKHRIAVLWSCRISVRRVLLFQREYMFKMYVKMQDTEFKKLIQESQMDYQIIMNRPWGNNEYLTLCNNYFKGTSNLSFFNKYTHLLSRWNAGYTALKNDTDTAEKRNIAVHFFFNSPIALNCPWESITEKEQYELSFEEHFKDIFNTLAPHIILCDFDCSNTWLGKAAIDIERLPN